MLVRATLDQSHLGPKRQPEARAGKSWRSHTTASGAPTQPLRAQRLPGQQLPTQLLGPAAAPMGTPCSCAHSVQLPSYTATFLPGCASWAASRMMQAVVPLPQEATSGREGSMPAPSSTARSCSGGLNLCGPGGPGDGGFGVLVVAPVC